MFFAELKLNPIDHSIQALIAAQFKPAALNPNMVMRRANGCLWSLSHHKGLPYPQDIESKSMAITIRPAKRTDIPQILAFIRALADYEHEPQAVIASEADLERDGFGPSPFYFCLIAEQDSRPAGFAFYFFNYSTWLGRPGLYLEDLFVSPEFRNQGVGHALLQKVAAIAVEKGCPRLQWEVLDWNTPAIEFYRAAGAEFLDEWRNVRVTGDALLHLATCDGADGACAS